MPHFTATKFSYASILAHFRHPGNIDPKAACPSYRSNGLLSLPISGIVPLWSADYPKLKLANLPRINFPDALTASPSNGRFATSRCFLKILLKGTSKTKIDGDGRWTRTALGGWFADFQKAIWTEPLSVGNLSVNERWEVIIGG